MSGETHSEDTPRASGQMAVALPPPPQEPMRKLVDVLSNWKALAIFVIAVGTLGASIHGALSDLVSKARLEEVLTEKDRKHTAEVREIVGEVVHRLDDHETRLRDHEKKWDRIESDYAMIRGALQLLLKKNGIKSFMPSAAGTTP
jgi:hypothetical protein